MIRLRQADEGDAAAIAAIYAPFVRDTAITFETEMASEADIGARMRDGGALYPWIVAEDEAGGALLGYAYASGFRSRAAYRFAVETTVYVDPEAQGRGAGEALYRLLVATLTEQGFTQAIGAIALPNQASVRLHEKLGFAQAGLYRKVGWKLGAWHDVGLWQRPLAPSACSPDEPRVLSELRTPLQRR